MEEVEKLLEEIKNLLISGFDNLEKKINNNPEKKRIVLDGEVLLDNQDLCLMFGLTKRSIASYRQKNLITYYQIDRKVFYKASEIGKFLKKKGK